MLIKELLNKIQAMRNWAISIEEQHSVTHSKRQFFISVSNGLVRFDSPIYPDEEEAYSKKIAIIGDDEPTEMSLEDMKLMVEILENYKEIIQHWLVERNIDDTRRTD